MNNFENVVSFERSPNFYYDMGMKKYDSGELDMAAVYFRKAYSMSKSEKSAMMLFQIFSAAAIPEYAIRHALVAFPNPDNRPAEVLFGLAYCYAIENEFLQSRMYFDKYMQEGESEYIGEDSFEALISTDLTCDIGTCDPKYTASKEQLINKTHLIGKELLAADKFDIAMRLYGRCLTICPEATVLYPDLTFACFLADNSEGAAHALERIHMDNSCTELSLYCIAIILKVASGIEDINAIEDDLKLLREIDSDEIIIIFYLFATFTIIEKFDDALVYAKKMFSQRPYAVPENNHLGIALFNTGDYQGAKKCYSRILKFCPDDIVAAERMRLCDIAEKAEDDSLKLSLNYSPCYSNVQKNIKILEAFRGPYPTYPDMTVAEAWKTYNIKFAILNFLVYMSPLDQKSIIKNALLVEDEEEIVDLYTKCLLHPEMSYSVKSIALKYLMKIDEQPYYRIAFGNLIIEGSYGLSEDIKLPKNFKRASDLCIDKMKKTHKHICVIAACELIKYYTGVEGLVDLDEDEILQFAAAIYYYSFTRCLLNISEQVVFYMFEIDEDDLRRGITILEELESSVDDE